MQITKKSRRGVTMAELVVVLALVSVISVMVFSFVMLIQHRSRANAANDAVRQDREMIEAGIEAWVKKSLEDGATFSIRPNTTAVQSAYPEHVNKWWLLEHKNGVLYGSYPDANQLQIRTQTVTKITFYLMKSSGKNLLFCTVTSEIEDFGGEATYTFCVPFEVESGGTP